MASPLPKTTMGLIGFIILVGFIAGNMFGSLQSDPLVNVASTAQKNIVSASGCLSGGGNSSSGNIGSSGTCNDQWFGAIGAVFSIVYNVLLMIFIFLSGIFLSFVSFIAVLTGLPIWIATPLISLMSVGLIFSILSKVIDI